MERFELIEGTSAKFWEVGVDGSTLTVRFGRIGADGQSKDKAFDTAAAAVKERDKLVKEKTGKGYTPVGEGAAVAPRPAAAPVKKAIERAKTGAEAAAPPAPEEPAQPLSPDAAVEADRKRPPAPPSGAATAALDALVAEKALPSRSRPGAPLDAARSWSAFRTLVTEMFASAGASPETQNAADWIRARLGADGPVAPVSAAAKAKDGGAMGWLKSKLGGGDAAPAPTAGVSFGATETRDWFDAIVTVARTTLPNHWSVKSPAQGRRLECLSHFAQWVVAETGALTLAEVAATLRPTDEEEAYRGSSWSLPSDLALRTAFAKAPEAGYDAALRLFQRMVEKDAPNWKTRAYLAFLLADDRPERHDLQPLAVLEAAEAAGEDVGARLCFIPLVAESRPSAAARWRSRRSYFLYMVYCEIGIAEVAATMIAVARAHGESVLPALDWLLHYAADDDRTEIARMALACGEIGALGALAPFLHEKWIRAALDRETEADPPNVFRQCVSAAAYGRAEPAIKARVADAIERHGAETVRGWAGADPKSASWLEKLFDARSVELAPKEAWPVVLRDPPWRKKAGKASDDMVLGLAPTRTPFAYAPPSNAGPEYRWRRHGARVLTSMDELPALIAEIEGGAKQSWLKIPEPSMRVPAAGSDPAQAVRWLETRLTEVHRARAYAVSSVGWDVLYRGLDQQPDALALSLWECAGPNSYGAQFTVEMFVRFGERALPGFVKLVETDPVGMLPGALLVDAGEIAPLAARALLKLKKARAPASAWLRRHRRTAMTRLIPDAVGKKGAARDAAEHALRWFAAESARGREDIETIAADYARSEPQVVAAVADVLDRDPLARFPAKVPKVPAWFSPSAVTAPELTSGGALSVEAVVALVEMLSFSTPDAVYAGVDQVRDACTPRSVATFSWDLFSVWLANGAPSKDGWAMRTVGWLGDDECARQLTRLIRKWPGEAAHARAVTGLDVLVDIGSDVALMNLNGVAEKLKFKGLQDKAREKIAQLAEARDLTPEELSDRLAPDLDLDERGGLDLDFGERRFRAGFDEFLKPWVKDLTGARLKDLPKPNRSDDAALSAASVARWAALKKDARAVASLQITRLEAMLSTSRRVKREVFWTFFASHPLIRHLSQRLVWGVYGDADPRTAPGVVFRVSDDLSVTDAEDETLALDFSNEERGVIGLVHPLHLPEGGFDPWGALFGDYEISQPFPQLGRETYDLTETEKASDAILRFEGVKVEAARLRGMGARGWPPGSPQDSGVIHWLERDVTYLDGKSGTVMLDFGDGLFSGAAEHEDKVQRLGKLTTYSDWYGQKQAGARTFGELDRVTASEMLRGLSLLAETRLA